MIYVLYIALAFLAMRVAVALVNLLSRPYLGLSSDRLAPEGQCPKVSVLIPARNEEENLLSTLESLLGLDYPNLEVIVLDDNSSDGTYRIARDFASTDDRFEIVRGRPLPEGWLGKNWACNQLAHAASGEYLLFIDADVTLETGAIEAGLVEMEAHSLSLLSVFPDQIMVSQGEKLVVPVMHYLLLSLLPLKMVTASKNPAFAAANGQYMLFRAADYYQNPWHERVKTEIVEDIEIMKQVKKSGLKGRVLLGNRLVKCRMYHNFDQGWKGFSKNLLAGFNHSIIGLFIYLFLVVFAWGAFFFEPGIELLAAFVGMAVSLRLGAFHFGQAADPL